jgi:hypothetical protein
MDENTKGTDSRKDNEARTEADELEKDEMEDVSGGTNSIAPVEGDKNCGCG